MSDPGEKPKPPLPPHWTTYITPIIALSVSMLSLYLAWSTSNTNLETAAKNLEATRLSQRPFLTLSYPQKPSVSVDPTDPKTLQFVLYLSLTNVGKTPAYDVSFKSNDHAFECEKVRSVFGADLPGSKLSIPPAGVQPYDFQCRAPGETSQFSLSGEHPHNTLFDFHGTLTYFDYTGYEIRDPYRVPVTIEWKRARRARSSKAIRAH